MRQWWVLCFFCLGSSCQSDERPTVSVATDAGRPRAGATAPRPASDAGPAPGGSAAYAGDAGDTGPTPIEHDAAENAVCDSQLMAAWAAHPPSLGRGSSASAAAYENVISALMKKYEVPGAALAVTRAGQLVFARGYGWADRE